MKPRTLTILVSSIVAGYLVVSAIIVADAMSDARKRRAEQAETERIEKLAEEMSAASAATIERVERAAAQAEQERVKRESANLFLDAPTAAKPAGWFEFITPAPSRRGRYTTEADRLLREQTEAMRRQADAAEDMAHSMRLQRRSLFEPMPARDFYREGLEEDALRKFNNEMDQRQRDRIWRRW